MMRTGKRIRREREWWSESLSLYLKKQLRDVVAIEYVLFAKHPRWAVGGYEDRVAGRLAGVCTTTAGIKQ